MSFDAVPLVVPLGDKPIVGSGFFISNSGREWLVTAAHVPLMLPTPHSQWNEWPDNIQIWGHSSARLSLNLRIKIGSAYFPTFAHLKGNANNIADFMALPIPIGTANSMNAKLFPLNHAHLIAGSKAEVVGYPSKNKPWPQLERVPVIINGFDNEMVYYKDPAPPGTSGGPLISSDGCLLGMSFGADNELGKAVSNFAMRYIIDKFPTIGYY